MSERSGIDLTTPIRKMNLAERDKLVKLGYEVTEKGDVIIPERKPGLLLRLLDTIDRELHRPPKPESTAAKKITRRKFIQYASTLAMLGIPILSEAAPALANDELLTAEESGEGQYEQALQAEIEQILGNRTGGFYLERRVPGTAQVIGRVEHSAEVPLPVASAFKAFVLGAYLELLPTEEWQFDRSSPLFNMVVYSHNLATGQLLHLVGERLRESGQVPEEQNDLQAFNTYLESHGISRLIGSWGFNGPTEGQQDTSAFREVSARRSPVVAANTITPTGLKDGYKYFLDSLGSQDPMKLEMFKYMLSLRDMRFLSPLESDLLQYPLYAKDGYLTAGTFPGFGPTRVDAGCIDLPDGTQIIVNLTTFSESDVVANQLADAVSRYVTAVCKDASSPVELQQLSAETRQLIHERFRYRYANEVLVDQPGLIVPERQSLEWLSDVCENLTDGDALGGLVTVNLSTGEVAMIELDEELNPSVRSSFVGLVGERLSYGDPAVSEEFANSRFHTQGNYDSEHGVLWQTRQDKPIPQHSLTTPMVTIVDSTSSAAGFGDLNTTTPVPFLVMRAITGNEAEGYQLTETNSEVTVHAMPQLPANDPGFQHYSARREVTEKVNNLYADGIPVQDGHDPYWSHGCVNMLPSQFELIANFVRENAALGMKVAVALSYQGLTDLSSLSFSKGYNLRSHPFYKGNFTTSTGLYFSEISR